MSNVDALQACIVHHADAFLYNWSILQATRSQLKLG